MPLSTSVRSRGKRSQTWLGYAHTSWPTIVSQGEPSSSYSKSEAERPPALTAIVRTDWCEMPASSPTNARSASSSLREMVHERAEERLADFRAHAPRDVLHQALLAAALGHVAAHGDHALGAEDLDAMARRAGRCAARRTSCGTPPRSRAPGRRCAAARSRPGADPAPPRARPRGWSGRSRRPRGTRIRARRPRSRAGSRRRTCAPPRSSPARIPPRARRAPAIPRAACAPARGFRAPARRRPGRRWRRRSAARRWSTRAARPPISLQTTPRASPACQMPASSMETIPWVAR